MISRDKVTTEQRSTVMLEANVGGKETELNKSSRLEEDSHGSIHETPIYRQRNLEKVDLQEKR